MIYQRIINESQASIEREDLEILLPMVGKKKPQVILEIGTWRGYSVKVWRDAFKPRKIATIESDEKEMPKPTQQLSGVTYILGSSHDLTTVEKVKEWLGEDKIDFLFIDGDHSYQGAMDDFYRYGALMSHDGVIAFHDALYHADKTEEVDQVWEQLKKTFPEEHRREIKESKISTGIGVIFL